MIIEKAYKAIELSETPNITNTYNCWQYYSIKIGVDNYRWVEEYNSEFGYYVRQFMINDRICTDVKNKFLVISEDYVKDTLYINKEEILTESNKSLYVSFDTSNGLCGARPFDLDCIFFEYFLKPLGVTENDIKEHFPEVAPPCFIDVLKLLRLLNINYELVFKCNYKK